MELYQLTTDASEISDGNLLNTVTIKKEGGVTYGQIQNASISITEDDNGALTINYNFSPSENCYLAVTVTDSAGNSVSSNKVLVNAYVGCFTAGTQVHTPSGLVNIENIQVGDEVCSIELTTGAVVTNPVTWVQENVYASAVYTIRAGAETFTVTGSHPVYVVGRDWVTVENLKVGDKLMDQNGDEIVITDIAYTVLDKPVQVHNFTVDGTHNYLVTESGILVHNK